MDPGSLGSPRGLWGESSVQVAVVDGRGSVNGPGGRGSAVEEIAGVPGGCGGGIELCAAHV